MKILIVASDPRQGLLFYPSKIAIELKKNGQDVHVATWGKREQTPGLMNNLKKNGIKIYFLNFLHLSGIRALVSPCNVDQKNKINLLFPDLIHTFGPISLYQLRKALPKSNKAKWVSMIAAMGHASRSDWGPKLGAIILNHYADLIIAQCHRERERLIRVGARQEKTRILYPPMDCKSFLKLSNSSGSKATIRNRYGLPGNKNILGCFSNFQYRKRQDLILRAFFKLEREYPNWILVMAGEGPERSKCINLSNKMNLTSKVFFLNRIPTGEMPSLLNTVDAVVHASNAETFGYSMVEPLLFKKPTLITSIGIGHEIDRDKRAIVIKPDNLSEMLNGMKRILNPGKNEKLIFKSSKNYVINNFDLPVITSRLIALYAGLFKN